MRHLLEVDVYKRTGFKRGNTENIVTVNTLVQNSQKTIDALSFLHRIMNLESVNYCYAF